MNIFVKKPVTSYEDVFFESSPRTLSAPQLIVMKANLLRLVVSACLCFSGFIHAQGLTGSEALEAKFKGMMTGVTMTGRWCSVKDGSLGPEKEDKYSIVGVEKKSGDAWVINWHMKYGKLELTVPIPVQVKWAGDTAVIVVDQMQIPGISAYGSTSYSARVLVHDNAYAGTWSGGDHSGLIKGVIIKDQPQAK